MRRSLASRLAQIALLVGAAGLGPMAAGASATNLLYYGGPVVHSAHVFLVQWGSHVRSTYTDSATGDPGFFRYLASQNGSTSDIGGVLAQYMDTTGHNSQNHFSFGGSVQITPPAGTATSVSDADLQTALANNINSGTLPAPSGTGLSTVYVVLFPPNVNVCFGTNTGCAYDSSTGFCAYHGSLTLRGSTHVLYAAMPDDGPGTPNDGYCGWGTDINNQTSVVSHELAETINDPLVAESPGYGPPLGWYDATANEGEIADKCDAAPLAGNGPWTVEPLWSNLDGNCKAAEPSFTAPTATFLAPASGSPGQPLSFDGSASTDPAHNHASAFEQGVGSTFSIPSGIESYRWNWGDGTPVSTSATPTSSHAFTTIGTYQVSLTVTDDLGFSSTRTRSVAVTATGTRAPVTQTGAATQIDSQRATLNGTVNPENQTVSYWFDYGTRPKVLGHSTPSTPGPGGQSATAVSATLSGLSPSATYYYRLVISAGASTYTGSVRSFTTTASSGISQTPVAATGPAARVTATGALLTGAVNPGGPASVTYTFRYGTSRSSLSQSTSSGDQPGGTTSDPVSATLTGLRPKTTYYVELEGSLGGQSYPGRVRSFTTGRLLPAVRTGRVRNVISNSATVSGWVNPHGTSTVYEVQFGASSSYGHSTTFVLAGSGRSGRRVRAVLFGLHPSRRYHYRLVAENRGGTVVGSDRTFTTGRRLAAAPRFSFRAPARVSWRALRSHRLRLQFHCSKACTAHFVLTAAPAGAGPAVTAPRTLARGQAGLHRRGSGRTALRFALGARTAAVAQAPRVKLLLLGYAVAHRSSASPPKQARITLF